MLYGSFWETDVERCGITLITNYSQLIKRKEKKKKKKKKSMSVAKHLLADLHFFNLQFKSYLFLLIFGFERLQPPGVSIE